MKWLLKKYPFNAEQTVNILGEFGPLVALFIVNAMIDIEAGTWALIISTGLAIVAMAAVDPTAPTNPVPLNPDNLRRMFDSALAGEIT